MIGTSVALTSVEGEQAGVKKEIVHFINNGLMQSRRPPKAHVKTMLSAKDLEDNEGPNKSAGQIPRDFPISEARGLKVFVRGRSCNS